MMLTARQAAYEEGYDAYYNDDDVNPYDFESQQELHNLWLDGNTDAFCEDEAK